MLRLKQAIGACVLASVLMPAAAAHAATYYVATTGTNSNSGTSSQPFRSVAYAVSKMVAGDTTYVRGGAYNEGMIAFRRSGTQSAPIKLLNAPGQFPVIDCINKTAGDRIQIGGQTYVTGWITIEGFEIRDCHAGIKFANLHNSTIRRNWVHHNIASGIFGYGTRITIDRNRINSNGTPTTGSHGIYANGSYYTVTNNIIYDNQKFGIQLNGSSTSVYNPSIHAGPEYANSYNWTIANNTFAYQRTESGIVIWGSTCNNARIENNIFYENAVSGPSGRVQGINFISSCRGIQVRSNLAYASGSGGRVFLAGATEGVHYTASGNIVNTVNPRFVNAPATLPSSPNFSLRSESQAVDRGLSLSSNRTSYSGTARPQGSTHDIGAYEYSGSSQLAAPTSLQAVN